MPRKGAMLVIVKEEYDAMSREAAGVVAEHLRKKSNLVLGKPPRRKSPEANRSAKLPIHNINVGCNCHTN